MEKTNIISTKSIFLIFGLIVGSLIFIHCVDVFLLLFASFIIASAINPTVDRLSKKINRGWSIAIVVLGIIIVTSLILVPLFSVLTTQAMDFFRQAPEYWLKVQHYLAVSPFKNIIPKPETIINFSQVSEKVINQSVNYTMSFAAGLIGFFTLVSMVLFMLIDKDDLKNGFLNFFQPESREQAQVIVENISKRVGGYVRGLLILMISIGVLTAVALTIMKVPYASFLGLLAGVLELIPIIGPIASLIPAVLITLAIKPVLAIWVTIVYILIQRLENSVIAPLILAKYLDMPPLVIITVLMIAGCLLGIVGLILAPAIAAAGYVIVQELYLKKINS